MKQKKINFIKKFKIIKFFKTVCLIIKKTLLRFFENQDLLISNGLAFKTFIALAPVIVIIAGTLKIFPNFLMLKQGFIDLLKTYMPDSFEKVLTWLNDVVEKSGNITIVSFIFVIYICLDLLITIDNHVEKIWGKRGNYSLRQKLLKYWALFSATPFILGAYFYYFGIIRSVILNPFIYDKKMEEFIYAFIAFFLLTIIIFFSYFIIPNSKVNIRKALIVSALVSAAWIIVRTIFTYYTMIFIERWSLFFSSFAIIILFFFWSSFNWIALLFGIEFLCVWQNKLYLEEQKLKDVFLFDIVFLLLIIKEFYDDFKYAGNGKTIKELANKFNHNHDEIRKLLLLLVEKDIIICDEKRLQRFYLKKNINNIKLSDIESIIWKSIPYFDYKITPKFQLICEELGKYYYKHNKESDVYIKKIINF